MKKLWLVLVAVLVLVCWGGSAMAYCDKCGSRVCSVYYMDGGDNHWEVTKNCNYKVQLPHVVECEDMTKCVDCGNTTDLDNAEIRHNRAHVDAVGKWGGRYEEYIYSFDEYRHILTCFCGDVVFENEYHRAQCFYDYQPGTCLDCDVENAIILDENMRHYALYEDDDGLVKCSYCGYVKTEAVRLPGDADNNSSVTIDDAIAILSGNVSSESNADVNADGNVNEQDVLRIMQYLAGWGVTLQ